MLIVCQLFALQQGDEEVMLKSSYSLKWHRRLFKHIVKCIVYHEIPKNIGILDVPHIAQPSLWVGSCHSQCQRHVLLHPLQRIEQRWRRPLAVVLLLRSGAAHRQHVVIVEVMELRCSFVVTFASPLCFPACDWWESKGHDGRCNRKRGQQQARSAAGAAEPGPTFG